jgi:hypothetical protein
MLKVLKAVFAGVLLTMIAVTVLASRERSVFVAFFDLVRDRWVVATLADAYFGFLTFYLWVAYKERTAGGRVIWFVLIMTLGNIAMASYMLLQLLRLPAGATVETLLLRRPA